MSEQSEPIRFKANGRETLDLGDRVIEVARGHVFDVFPHELEHAEIKRALSIGSIEPPPVTVEAPTKPDEEKPVKPLTRAEQKALEAEKNLEGGES